MTDASAEWSDADTAAFLDYGDIFVPEREKQIQLVADRVFDRDDETRSVFDLCSGQGLMTRAILEKSPDVTVTAFDASDEMLKATRKTAAHLSDRLITSVFRLEDQDWRTAERSADAVISSLAIHHLEGIEKRDLFRYVHSILNPGGVFAVADLTEPLDESEKALFADEWDAEVKRRSNEKFGDERGFDRFRELEWNYYLLDGPDDLDKPSPLSTQLEWMAEVGFSDVTAHWQLAGHAVFSGVKSRP